MAKKKAEKSTENAGKEYPGTKNLVPVRTKEEAKERGRNGGLKSAEVRRKKRTMRDMAKGIMETTVSEQMSNVRETLARMGLEENDMTYQAAVVVRLIQKAMVEGDTSAIRVLGELTGELNRFGYVETDDPDVIEMQYPTILIPENGRDAPKENVLGPQAGPQTMFMASSADIVIYGGAAGGGKTYALLLEALRHKDVKNFGAVIFRKNFTQITAEGGLWDASAKIFSQVPDAQQRKTPKLHWKFNAGAKLTFAHLDREEDLQAWQGTEIAYLAFDELTHFTKHQFLYMLSRNRSTCGIKPYVRATCNPDSDSWVADFISWWIDQDTGYPIRERSGVIRYYGNIRHEVVQRRHSCHKDKGSHGCGSIRQPETAFEQQREHDETGWGLVMTIPKEVSDETSAMKHEKFKSAAQEQMSARAFWQGNEEGKKFDPGTKIAGKAEQKMALGGI